MAHSPTAARARDRYADVGRATRAAFEQARDADLTRNELLTLLAVLDATVTWSRLDERLTIRQVAARRYGVEEQEATRTHTNKTTAALRGLAAKGVIVYETAGTRPGGAHRIGLPPAPAAPTGGTRPRSDPGRDPRPDPGREPASCTLYARDEEVPRTISEPTPHRPAGEVSEPGLVSGPGGDGPEDPLVGRLVALCGPAHRRSATAVVAKLCRDFDRRVIEEMVTWAEQAEQPTRSPRRLLAMAETWGPQRGVFPTSGTAAVGTGPPPELVDDLSGGSASGDRWPPDALSGTHVAGFDVDAGDELAVPAELPAGFFDELRERLRGGRAAAGGQL